MRVNRIDSSNNAVFGRQMNAKELQVYTKSLNEGLGLLNKRMDIIIHNSSAPAVAAEDTGIGSLFSRTVQTKLMPFLKSHGFTGIQQEPNNYRNSTDFSPYAPESSAKNIFMIPLEKLSTEEFGNILPIPFFKHIVINKPKSENVSYSYVSEQYDKLLRVAFYNFKSKNDGTLKEEYEQFKNLNSKKLEQAAIFNILNKKHNSHWETWNNIDKNLYSPRNQEEAKLTQERIDEIKEEHKNEINFFTFCQFLVEKANKESNNLAQKSGIKIIGDSPVASPSADEWVNQNLFLKDKAIGCPPDYFAKEGQRWGFKYFNPKYIFNPDGTLGKAGKILKEKYDNFFASFPGGLRIDHVIGLVDPFIYTVSEKMTKSNSGRIYSMDGEFKKTKEEYSNILEKIVLQSAKEHGMEKDDIICEDLGDPNLPTQMVMDKLKLSGIAVTQFDYRGAKTPQRNVIMIGSHDNKSFIEYTDEFFGKVKGENVNERSNLAKLINRIKKHFHISQNEDLAHFMRKTKLLAEDTVSKDATKQELKEYKQQLRTDKNKFMEASFAELFTSPAKRIQIFFADFWGLGKTYNRPGTTEGNWALRIPSDFEGTYYKAVAEGKAPNLAKAVMTALKQRGLDKNNKKLMQNLEESARILSET